MFHVFFYSFFSLSPRCSVDALQPPQVSRKTSMSYEAREVALARVARSPKAAAFTGADLQAVVDTAQLTAIHCYLEVRWDR